jgi:hypothetical protein
MITVQRCQLLAAVGRWTSPKVMVAIIVALLGSIDPLEVRSVQNVLMPLIGFHDGNPSGYDKRDKQNGGNNHLSILPDKHCIED